MKQLSGVDVTFLAMESASQFGHDFHVRHTAVAPPGGDEQLSELVARPRR